MIVVLTHVFNRISSMQATASMRCAMFILGLDIITCHVKMTQKISLRTQNIFTSHIKPYAALASLCILWSIAWNHCSMSEKLETCSSFMNFGPLSCDTLGATILRWTGLRARTVWCRARAPPKLGKTRYFAIGKFPFSWQVFRADWAEPGRGEHQRCRVTSVMVTIKLLRLCHLCSLRSKTNIFCCICRSHILINTAFIITFYLDLWKQHREKVSWEEPCSLLWDWFADLHNIAERERNTW